MRHLRPARMLAWLAVAYFAAKAVMFNFSAGLLGPMMITELDRNDVINAGAVQAHYPQFASNLRHDLGLYVTRELAASGNLNCVSALIFSVAVALYLKFGQAKPPGGGASAS